MRGEMPICLYMYIYILSTRAITIYHCINNIYNVSVYRKGMSLKLLKRLLVLPVKYNNIQTALVFLSSQQTTISKQNPATGGGKKSWDIPVFSAHHSQKKEGVRANEGPFIWVSSNQVLVYIYVIIIILVLSYV